MVINPLANISCLLALDFARKHHGLFGFCLAVLSPFPSQYKISAGQSRTWNNDLFRNLRNPLTLCGAPHIRRRPLYSLPFEHA